MLVGEPGTRKTAIAERACPPNSEGIDVPENLKTKQIYSLDMGAPCCGVQNARKF